MSDPKAPNLLELTPLNPAFMADQHGAYDRLRGQCPVHWDAQSGEFMLSRHADVRGVVSDRSLWRNPEQAAEEALLARGLVAQRNAAIDRTDELPSILFLDDPDHARIRQPLAQALYARVAKFRPEVERIVDATLAAIGARDEFDVMADFALPIPIDVIASILGVDHERLGEFRQWSEDVIQSLNPMRGPEASERMARSGEALRTYMAGAMHDRRKSPRDDLVTDMVKLQAEGAPLTDGEVCMNLQALLVGGNLTTTDLIGNAIRLFLLNPDQRAKLMAEPALIGGAVEEVLRYDGPVDITSRIASRDMEVAGCPVKQRQSVVTMLRAANRDPEAWPDPHRFDITRKGPPHVAFGGGAHICIGAPLARLEAQAAIPRFLARYPTLALADPDAPPQWRKLPFFHGLERLDVRVA